MNDPNERTTILPDGFIISLSQSMGPLLTWTVRTSDGGNIPHGLRWPQADQQKWKVPSFLEVGRYLLSDGFRSVKLEGFDAVPGGHQVKAYTAKHALYLLSRENDRDEEQAESKKPRS